ncbi:MAG: NADH-quinone oxidoreductase subunit L [Rhizobiales bacterium]|nr:NADH-quinone oxidoreductase subunit L [Hyphomicrobiales bacterium]NRB12856.1 NADH-quinone oxidoreductase subunit L [Hyphomicrobiales bacterium]
MYTAIVFLPILASIFAGVFGRYFDAKVSEYLTSGVLVFIAFLSWVVLLGSGFEGETLNTKINILTWIDITGFKANWIIRVDMLTAVMFVVVNTVSAVVHVYSIGYMHNDPHRIRFFSYLSFFTFAMLTLITADNFLQMFFGWEGVGVASYLLIGFWYKKQSAGAAAMKAFIVNRVGDFGFALGIFGVLYVFGSVDFDTVFTAAPDMVNNSFNFLGYDVDILTTLSILLFIGAMGKSAQFLLHTWLPDAMEGPTPVSALIHAATMVTAGVFLVARCSPLFELAPDAMNFVTLIGATTAFFAATVGLVQNDIKRVIAYSTASQLGYMFVALGVGAYQAAIFHLFTHAFFKALLFLGAGSVIHAMSDEQDMRKMGGIWKKIPKTYVMMLVGTLALTGFPLTAGYFSKDAIIEAAFVSQNYFAEYAFYAVILAALMTSFYSWRLIFMTFHGKSRASKDVLSHVHESPNIMLVPLYILAAGALLAGILFVPYFIGDGQQAFWFTSIYTSESNQILHDIHGVSAYVKYSPFVMMLIGFGLAYQFYIRQPQIPVQLAARFDTLYRFLLNKWYFDEVYDFVFVKGAQKLGTFLAVKVDKGVIDRYGPDGIAALVFRITARVSKFQSGLLYHYAFVMLIGVAVMLTYFVVWGAR